MKTKASMLLTASFALLGLAGWASLNAMAGSCGDGGCPTAPTTQTSDAKVTGSTLACGDGGCKAPPTTQTSSEPAPMRALVMAMPDRSAEVKMEAAAAAPKLDFTLEDQDGKNVTLADYSDKIVVLEWVNPGCPFVVRHYKEGTMLNLAKKYADKGVVWLAINSTNSATNASNKEWVTAHQLTYPILNDSQGTVGHQYGAKTTPHIYIIKAGQLLYKGAIDNDPKGNMKERVNYVDNALGEILEGKSVSTSETKSYGCSVKYAK